MLHVKFDNNWCDVLEKKLFEFVILETYKSEQNNHMEKISSLVAARCTTILLWALIGKF